MIEPRGDIVRFATYNIHGCVGGDGRYAPQRILHILAQLDADVIALQEVARQAGPDDPLTVFAGALDCTVIRGPTLQREDGEYGNALLTRRRVARVRRMDLSVAGREPRGALDVHLAGPSGAIRVVATHLGLRPAERRRQIRQLLGHLDADRAEVTVLMGDLNEWFLWGRPLRYLHRAFARMPAYRTYPARFPLLALDRIWVHPPERVRTVKVFRHADAHKASDHLPVVVSIDARAPRPGA